MQGITITVHDYTKRYWGHDFAITEVIDRGQQLKAHGWGQGISKDDYLILPDGTKTTRYLVEEIEYQRDPSDMWFATLRFAPRPTP